MIINENDVWIDEDVLYDWEVEGDDNVPWYCEGNCSNCWIGCGV